MDPGSAPSGLPEHPRQPAAALAWRAPIHRAIEAGDAETGVTIMQMDAGLDTGDMLLTERLPIAPSDTTATLHDRLATLGGRMIVEALELAACGGSHCRAATGRWHHPTPTRSKRPRAPSTGHRPPQSLASALRVRSLPGASTECKGETIKIWAMHLIAAQGISDQRPGQILAADGAR